MKEYSIKNVADLLGTTKNTIKYRMKKLPPELVKKNGAQWVILEDAIDLLRNDQRDPGDQSGSDPDRSDPARTKDEQKEIIKILADQVEYLKSQIENKDHQIEELSASLKAEQSINIHNSQLLSIQNETILKLEADTKKSWISRIFSRSR